jgi:hypothetical protein
MHLTGAIVLVSLTTKRFLPLESKTLVQPSIFSVTVRELIQKGSEFLAPVQVVDMQLPPHRPIIVLKRLRRSVCSTSDKFEETVSVERNPTKYA